MVTVLIADDDVDAWFRVNALLRKHLIKANFVINLAAARQFIEKQVPTLLFFDNHLQDTATPDFIQYVKTKYPQVKIIMINGNAEFPVRFKYKNELCISKPLIPETIERTISKLLYNVSNN